MEEEIGTRLYWADITFAIGPCESALDRQVLINALRDAALSTGGLRLIELDEYDSPRPDKPDLRSV